MNSENNINSYLSFYLNNECFGVSVLKVLEIIEMPTVTLVPRSPEALKGVFNLRGKVIPMLDTRISFNFVSHEVTQDTCVIVMEVDLAEEKTIIGALVDKVNKVFEAEKEEILPAPSVGKQYNPAYIKGVIKVEEEFVMLLDINKVFSPEEMEYLITKEDS